MKCPKCGGVEILGRNIPDVINCRKCGFIGQLKDFHQKEEPMKTKKIGIKAQIDFKHDREFSVYGEEYRGMFSANLIPCTITFEIPIEEPSVSITPSDIDRAFKEAQNDPALKDRCWIVTDEIKKRLFPGWE